MLETLTKKDNQCGSLFLFDADNGRTVEVTALASSMSCDVMTAAPTGPTLLGEVALNDGLVRTIETMKNGVLPSADWLKELLGLSSEFNKKFTNVVAVNRGAAPYVNENGKRARSGTDPLEENNKLVIVGDLHGQFRDLMAIFEEVTGMPSEDIVYIFNGDLVDRGDMSVEIMITVLLAQQVYREKVIILRGNHETAWMNNSYGFAAEVRRKYSDSMLTAFHQVFNTLPIAAVIDKEIFVTHGGLGPKSHKMTVAEINSLNRFCEPAPNTPTYELLWNDPQKDAGFSPARCGTTKAFGPDITAAFLARNGLDLLVRSHEQCATGFCWHHEAKCRTIFSAANYENIDKNDGAVLQISTVGGKRKLLVKKFAARHYPVAGKITAAEESKEEDEGEE